MLTEGMFCDSNHGAQNSLLIVRKPFENCEHSTKCLGRLTSPDSDDFMMKTLQQSEFLAARPSLAAEKAVPVEAPLSEGGRLAFIFLWLFTFAVFGRPEDIVGSLNVLHLPLVLGISAAVLLAGALLTGAVRFRMPVELTTVLLLTCWFILGVPFAYWHGGSAQVLMDIWFKTLLSFLLTQTMTSIDRIKKIIWAILLSELLSTSASILLQGNGAEQVGERLSGVNQGLFGWNFLGIALSVTIPFIAMLYVSERSFLRTAILLATLGSSMWMLVLTASRGGFVGVLFSIILTWIYVLRGTSRGRVLGIVIALCMVLSVAKAPGVFFARLQTLWNNDAPTSNAETQSAEESTAEREVLVQHAIGYTLQNPILGVGVGNFPVINGKQHGASGWYGTHNTYLQFSAETGIPGLLMFLFLLATMFKHAKKCAAIFAGVDEQARLLGRAAQVSILSLMVAGLFAHIAYEYLIYYLAGITAGLWAVSMAYERDSQNQNAGPSAIRAVPRPLGHA